MQSAMPQSSPKTPSRSRPSCLYTALRTLYRMQCNASTEHSIECSLQCLSQAPKHHLDPGQQGIPMARRLPPQPNELWTPVVLSVVLKCYMHVAFSHARTTSRRIYRTPFISPRTDPPRI